MERLLKPRFSEEGGVLFLLKAKIDINLFYRENPTYST
jgi:hypothetical protein